jgi:ankyrin repeat protein
MLAVLACNVDVARALLEAGASVHTENEWGVTALFLAPTMEPLEHKRLACAALLFEYGASATHLDKTGQSAIMCAAAAGDAHIVDLFLSKGANIDERVMDITSLRENCTVFQQLCEEDKPFNNDIDSALANLLETYVFQAKQGPDKIRSVVEQGDAEDRTLLHYVARYSMVNSARVLLRHGANSNPLAKRYTMRSIDGKRFKIFWIETPLNEALNAYEARKKRMIEDRNLARKAYDDLCSRNMAMVMLLKDYGGVEASAEKHRKPVPSGMTSLRELRDL